MDEKFDKRNSSLLADPPLKEEIIEEQKNEAKERKIKLAVIFGGLIICILCGWGISDRLTRNYEESEKNDKQVLTSDERENILKDEYPLELLDKFAYIDDGKVIVNDFEGNNVVTLTSENLGGISIDSITWKGKDAISIGGCIEKTCSVKTYSFSDSSVSQSYEFTASKVSALRWSHDKNHLGILFFHENKFTLNIASGESQKSIYEVPGVMSEEFTYDDLLSLRFSPDDQKIMVTNTFIQQGNPSVVVLDYSGNIKLELIGEDPRPTFAFFMSNSDVFFKKNDLLYSINIDTQDQAKVTERIVGAFGFEPSPDRRSISYWSYDWNSGTTTMWVYNYLMDSIERLSDYIIKPEWISDSKLIGIYVGGCRACAYNKFFIKGFQTYDRQLRDMKDAGVIDSMAVFEANTY